MKPSVPATKSAVSAEECAGSVMEIVPLIMRTIKGHMRSQAPGGLTDLQFRTLIYLTHHEGACLSDVRGRTGLTLATMSKVVDVLVKRELVRREISTRDRRRVTLTVTPRGRKTLAQARRNTRAQLARALRGLAPRDRATIVAAVRRLQGVLGPGAGTEQERRAC
jgi:DNA-binding MarR family transcriptional regulator